MKKINKDDRNKFFNTLLNMSNNYETFNSAIKNAFINSLIKRKTNVITALIATFITSPFLIYIIKSNNTFKYINNLLNESSSFALSLFSITFTGYALFQALMSGFTLNQLLLDKNKKDYSKFEEFNLSFFFLNITILIICSINYILKIIMPVVNDFINKYSVYLSNDFKNTIFILLLIIYISIVIFILLEMKSFIFNIFQCFNIHAIAQGFETLKNNNDDIDTKNGA